MLSDFSSKARMFEKDVSTYSFFTSTKTKLNLALMRLVDEHKLSFAFPSTSIYIEKNTDSNS